MGNWDARQADLFSTSRFILQTSLLPGHPTHSHMVGWEPRKVAGGGLSSGTAGISMPTPGQAAPAPRLGFLWRCEIPLWHLLSAYYIPGASLITAHN